MFASPAIRREAPSIASRFVLLFFFVATGVVGGYELLVVHDFAPDAAFALGEFSARLEACASPSATAELKADCLVRLASPEFSCAGSGENATCVVGGVHVPLSAVSFACDGACPSHDASLAGLLPTTTAADCAPGPVNGFVGGDCYSNARCQWLSEASVVSFGEYCPASDGTYCCSSAAVRDDTAVPSEIVTSTSVDYLRDLSQFTDLSFRVHYDVKPPSSVRVTIDTPYVTSDRQVSFLENGVVKTYQMCPSAYMFDFADPVEPLPPATDGYFRRSTTQSGWLPLRYYPYLDLLGRPRTACGNFDFEYGSPDEFAARFGFPDLLNASYRFAYGGTPAVDPDAWAGLEGVSGVPSGNDTFWKMGTPVDGRVNYTAGFWDLVSGFYQCRDHETGTRLVERELEGDTYIGGVAYAVESYSWKLHLCQVGYFGPNCADTSTVQSYAKTCAVIPSVFSVAPRQVSHVDTSPTNSGLVSKSFLSFVASTRGGCSFGEERVVVVFSLLVFETDYVLLVDAAHSLKRPIGVFDGNQTDVPFSNATEFTSPRDFLASDPSAEGLYALRPFESVSSGGDGDVTHQSLVVVSRCFDTGHDPATRTRARGDAFANAVAGGTDRVAFELDVTLEKIVQGATGGAYTVRNSLTIRVLGTKDTFVLRSIDVMEQKGARATHALYANYETAAADVTSGFPNALPGDITVFAGDQICSKQQLVDGDAHGTALRPNAVGACVLSAEGEAAVDGAGVPLAGREIFYQTVGMREPASYVFGCFRNWINVSSVTPTSAGVYRMQVLERLPDVNHESTFWFVAGGALAETALPGSDTALDDRFGTGLFTYDETANAGAGANVATFSSSMQRDPITVSTPPEELTAGCAETLGNLRAACNLVCFDVEEGLLTSTVVGDNKTLVVHHVSVAVVVDAAGSAGKHRFGPADASGAALARRKLRGETSATPETSNAGARGELVDLEPEGARSRARRVRAVVREAQTGGAIPPPDDAKGRRGISETIMWSVVGCAAFVLIVALAVACVGKYCCTQTHKRKKFKKGGKAPW
jgi:hypothetical protein